MDGWINRQTISYNRNYIATTTTTPHDGTPHCATQQQHNITRTLPYFTPPITLHYVPQPQPAMFMFANWMHPFSYLYVQSNVTCQRNDFWIPKIWRSSTSSTARRIPVQKVCVPFTGMGLQHSLQLPNVGAHTSLPRYIFMFREQKVLSASMPSV